MTSVNHLIFLSHLRPVSQCWPCLCVRQVELWSYENVQFWCLHKVLRNTSKRITVLTRTFQRSVFKPPSEWIRCVCTKKAKNNNNNNNKAKWEGTWDWEWSVQTSKYRLRLWTESFRGKGEGWEGGAKKLKPRAQCGDESGCPMGQSLPEWSA